MKIPFVRHGAVEEYYQGRYNGHIDVGLCEHAKGQLTSLKAKLNAIAFDKVYASDLQRAKETCTLLGYSNVTFSKRLREKSWGRHEGMSFEEIEQSGIKYENFSQWIQALDGERPEIYTQRLQEYFYEEILTQDAEHILIITHAGVIKTLLHITQGISLEAAFSRELPYGSVLLCKF